MLPNVLFDEFEFRRTGRAAGRQSGSTLIQLTLMMVCISGINTLSASAATFDLTTPPFLNGATYLSNDSTVTGNVTITEIGTGGTPFAFTAGPNDAHNGYTMLNNTTGFVTTLNFSPPVTFSTLRVGYPNGTGGFVFSDYDVELFGGASLTYNNDGVVSGYNMTHPFSNLYKFKKTTSSSVGSNFWGTFAVNGPVSAIEFRINKTFPIGGTDAYRFEFSDFTSVVPEPASLALIGASALGLLGARRRRQRECIN